MTMVKGSSILSKITTYWLLGSSWFLSPSLSSAWARFWAVHRMSFGTSTPALVVTFFNPSDRIDWSDGGGDCPVVKFIGRERRSATDRTCQNVEGDFDYPMTTNWR